MTRRPRRRPGRLLPSVVRSERERREHLLSLGLIAAIQLAIAVSLAISAAQTYRMWRQGVPYLPVEVQRAVPAALALGALIAFLSGLRTYRGVRAVRKMPVTTSEREE